MSKDILVQIINYAIGFELAFASDDWTRIESYFTEDAVSEVQGNLFPSRCVGREAVLTAFKTSCALFDRQFDFREPKFFSPPELIEGGIYFQFVVTYQSNGLPPLYLKGEEWDYFRAERIERHVERFFNEDEVSEFLTRYCPHLLSERK